MYLNFNQDLRKIILPPVRPLPFFPHPNDTKLFYSDNCSIVVLVTMGFQPKEINSTVLNLQNSNLFLLDICSIRPALDLASVSTLNPRAAVLFVISTEKNQTKPKPHQ